MDAEDSADQKAPSACGNRAEDGDITQRAYSISLVVMIYGGGGALALIGIALVLKTLDWADAGRLVMIPASGCMLAFILGLAAHFSVICFGVMRFTLWNVLATTISAGLCVALFASRDNRLAILGGLLGVAVLLYWMYRFFEAAYEKDRRDGQF